jgi:hypothetical protein
MQLICLVTWILGGGCAAGVEGLGHNAYFLYPIGPKLYKDIMHTSPSPTAYQGNVSLKEYAMQVFATWNTDEQRDEQGVEIEEHDSSLSSCFS